MGWGGGEQPRAEPGLVGEDGICGGGAAELGAASRAAGKRLKSQKRGSLLQGQ